MKVQSPRTLLCSFYRYLMGHLSHELDPIDLQKSAIIFSPHEDDETLGCGGTLLLKKKLGAAVKVVFMTDGCRSHSHLISKNELRLIRAQEAVSACEVLGIDKKDVIFLNFEDGCLSQHQEIAIDKVAQILLAYQPEQVFIPYHKEGHLDHTITNSIVLTAVRMHGLDVTVYEYPVWFWFHWPWVSLWGKKWEIKSAIKNTISAGFGLRLLKDFRTSVSIGNVLHLKRAALEKHQTQMTQFLPDPTWSTLRDVSQGRFLDCLLQEREFFYRYEQLNENDLLNRNR
ncbi:PIG-L family deacetylase [Kovacikia minuta CCNUW1]|uniref:PIG-L deacetylase family protein n=1 Tax=Kovacikia minuta TaxID=2931930 RepID=UPI001CD029BF|nr:PIG-L deacetylase family protein [Kovacikia minuta]UBF27319.1 PIG-L family deacetylase [Kovacikia minuta CCNUW1]